MIRDACISDFNAILNLQNQVFQIHLTARPDMIKPKLPFNQGYFEQSLQDDNKKFLVFEKDRNILGYCIIQVLEYKDHHILHDMKIVEINDMCVDEKTRGNNIGRQFVDSAKDYAKEIGAARLELTVWGFNKSARQFYEHLGMSERTIRMEMSVDEYLVEPVKKAKSPELHFKRGCMNDKMWMADGFDAPLEDFEEYM